MARGVFAARKISAEIFIVEYESELIGDKRASKRM